MLRVTFKEEFFFTFIWVPDDNLKTKLCNQQEEEEEEKKSRVNPQFESQFTRRRRGRIKSQSKACDVVEHANNEE